LSRSAGCRRRRCGTCEGRQGSCCQDGHSKTWRCCQWWRMHTSPDVCALTLPPPPCRVQAAADAAAAPAKGGKAKKPDSGQARLSVMPGAAGGGAPTLQPPFAPVARGAALRCLVQLAREPGGWCTRACAHAPLRLHAHYGCARTPGGCTRAPLLVRVASYAIQSIRHTKYTV
jgi:hypothetical protein